MTKSKLFKILLICILLFCKTAYLSAQISKFRHYSVKDGISQSEIKCIFQDSEGYIWFGTQNGLNKFNGYTFEKYFFDPTDTTSISNAWIFGITEDPEGNLWVCTKDGVNRFNKSTRQFTRIAHTTSNSVVNDNFAYGITCDDTLIYVNTPPALSTININTGKLSSYTNNFEYDGALYDRGFPIIKDSQGLIWIGSNRGLYFFDPDKKRFTNFIHSATESNSISHNHITALYEDQDGAILIGTKNGLNRYNKEKREFTLLFHNPNSLTSNYIRSITRDHLGTLWIGTEGSGLNRIRVNSKTGSVTYAHFLSGTVKTNYISHDIIHYLYEDHSHNLWIGTSAGINKMDLKKRNYHWYKKSDHPNSVDLSDNIIASVYQDEKGLLWIGTWGKGLNIVNPETHHVVHYSTSFNEKRHIPNNHVHVIFKDSKSRIWLGTRNGIAIYDNSARRFIPITEYFGTDNFDLFKNNRVYCIIETSKGEIWIGTGNGIIILDTEYKQAHHIKAEDSAPNNIGSNLVYSLLEDRNNNIWIATSNGLDRYDTSKEMIYHYRNNPQSTNTLCDNYAISLCEDKEGNIWIGTSSGVNRFNRADSVFTHFSTQNGLPGNVVYDIIEDGNQNLWFSTGNGLASFNTDSSILKPFTIESELREMEFNIKAVYKGKGGRMFFGGVEGLISFHPDSLSPNTFIPPIVITSITKERGGIRQEISTYNQEIVMDYLDYAFDIEFSALDFTNPSRNEYSYQMKGLSDNWIKLGNRRFVPFTNIPPGNYTFNVKGSNNDGIWNKEGTSIKITILPPWWKNKYAYSGYLIISLLLIIFIIKYREQKLIQEKEILENRVQERTAEIALQKEKIQESEEKLRTTITSLDDLVFVLDKNGIFQECYNPSKRETIYSHPELYIHKHYCDVGLPQKVITQLNQVFKHKTNSAIFKEFDYSIEKEGERHWFNAKLSPRKNSRKELSGIIIVARDITRRKRAERQLEKQKNALKELNATKDKFFSILAHDLKNPFTTLYSLSELISTNYADLEDKDKIMVLEKIHQSAQLIFNLLENLLTWSRSQQGNIKYAPLTFNLSNIINQNINLHQVPAGKKGITLISNIEDDISAFGDQEMTNTVIRNLINNAIKFSKRDGTVSVAIGDKGRFVHISVTDQGVGIPPENLNKLFRIDVKYKSKGTAGEQGTGLGLVLCKEFVEISGGTIWCESQENRGSTFHFTIPKSPPTPS